MHILKRLRSYISLALKLLTSFDRSQIELAISWLSKSKPTLFILNVFMYSALFVVKLLLWCRKKLRNIKGLFSSNKAVVDNSEQYDAALSLRTFRDQPRVLILAEASIPQCFCYRAQQKLDQLNSLGWHCEWMPWHDSKAAMQRMHYVDMVILYRVPGFPNQLSMIEYAQSLRKIVIYDVDDLIFDRARLQEKFATRPEQLSNKEFQGILDGADLYKAAIQACSYAITTTTTLQAELADLVKEKQCYVLPNALSTEVYDVMQQPKPLKQTDRVTLIYGSGTRTHDEDFALVAAALIKLLQQHPNLHVVILGYLTLPKSLDDYSERIQRLPMLGFASYLSCLRQADISIAPLESGVFADAKSEIKWLEAAAFNIPSVVSKTVAYDEVIEHGKTGFIAQNSDDWYRHLNELISKPLVRGKIGKAASKVAFAKYGRESMNGLMSDVLHTIQHDAVKKGNLLKTDKKRCKILFVNVLYAPASLGGATIVLERIVDKLKAQYGKEFDITVLASDIPGTRIYNVREYSINGVNVSVIGVPVEPELELKQQSSFVKKIFTEVVEQQRPDIIHYHCIQRLTGSVVEVAKEKQIPYVITVHDGWWLSEYQFMLNKQNQLINPNQLNPLVAMESASDLPASIERTRYLSSLLQGAEKVFAVSEYQANIYRNNGFNNVQVNRNGMLPVSTYKRPAYKGHKLRIGYLGGVCEHKGYYFLKDIVSNNEFANLQFLMVDIFQPRDYAKQQQWGATEVQHVGHYKVEQLQDFYANIDVLIAPSIWPESFGLVSREAALHGVWVIAADAGGMAEDIIEGKTGWVYAMRDAEALQGTLKRLNNQASDYIKQRPDIKASQQKITTLQQQVAELVEQYQDIVK